MIKINKYNISVCKHVDIFIVQYRLTQLINVVASNIIYISLFSGDIITIANKYNTDQMKHVFLFPEIFVL